MAMHAAAHSFSFMLHTQDILRTLGFDAFTPMQEAMHRAGQQPGGVVLLSPTGSGKTLAYLVPLVQQLAPDADRLQAVIVTPTRELAQQSDEVLKSMKTGLRSIALYGGRAAMEEHRRIRDLRPQIVFATPGRLNDHLDKGNLVPHGVRTLVIDEFDKCLELGFQDEVERIVARFSGVAQCWLTSATDAEEIPAFMEKLRFSYEKLDFTGDANGAASRTAVYEVQSPQKDKLDTLGHLLTELHGQQTIVFVGYRESVDRVCHWLREQRFAAVAYHGGMEQEARERALYRFRCGAANVLVSTDLAARGLDIPEVRAVVHYHLPAKAEDFTHRNGRTARWEAEGSVFLLTGPAEQLPEFAGECTPFPLDAGKAFRPAEPLFTTLYIGRGKRDKLSKGDILGFLCKKGGLRADEIGRIDVGAHHAYAAVPKKRLAQMMKLIGGEKIKGMKTLIEEMRK